MKVLIIGASGFLGSTLYKKFTQNGAVVIGTFNSNQIDAKQIKMNLFNLSDIERVLLESIPDVIVWAVCDYENENRLTDIGIKYILNCINNSIKFVYISTTISEGPLQRETVNPVYRTEDMYLYKYVNGKIDGEKLVKAHKNHIIVRPGSIYGVDGYNRLDTRTATIKEKIENKIPYVRADNLVTSFVNVNDLAKAIVELIDMNFIGTINIAGDIPVSHYYFSKKRAESLGLDTNYITAETKDTAYEYSLDTTNQRNLLQTNIQNL
ncbi:MAG: sugar nucleotide-binding protein [Clostridia bacterium]|nr:sugar nucleotide-binding protein [Clostridia bacterium]